VKTGTNHFAVKLLQVEWGRDKKKWRREIAKRNQSLNCLPEEHGK
jgi:hypothetical protein